MMRMAIVLFLAVLVHHPAEASGQAGGVRDSSREELVRRVQQGFEARLTRELGLDEDQRVALRAIFEDFARDRRDLAQRRRALGREIVGFMRRDIEDMAGASEGRAMELIEELRAIRSAEEALIRSEEDRLLDVLRPVQLLRLQLVREEFLGQIRRLDPDPPFGR